MAKGEGKVVAQNKKARHDYTIVDTIEAGMVLTGTEIKSVRAARINLKTALLRSRTVRPGSAMSISRLMKREISGTKSLNVAESCCCIRSRSKSWSRRPRELG